MPQEEWSRRLASIAPEATLRFELPGPRAATVLDHRGPEELHLVFYSVGGDQDFLPFISYLERFGVPWAVICDGAAFRLDIRKHIFKQVLDVEVDDPELEKYVKQEGIASRNQTELDSAVFESMVEAGRAHGVFTLAIGWHRKADSEGDDEPFEPFVGLLPELAEAAKIAHDEAPKNKPRAGRLLAEATDCPPAVDQLSAHSRTPLPKGSFGVVLSRTTRSSRYRHVPDQVRPVSR